MRGDAGQYWADTAEGYFVAMTSEYQQGEDVVVTPPEPKAVRRTLPPLVASDEIIAAIAAGAPQQTGDAVEPDRHEVLVQTV